MSFSPSQRAHSDDIRLDGRAAGDVLSTLYYRLGSTLLFLLASSKLRARFFPGYPRGSLFFVVMAP